MTLAFEDFRPGQSFAFGACTVTKEEVVAFAREFDPQPFHLDEDAAKASLLRGLAASGWHTCAMTMRMTVDALLRDSTGVGSPGVEVVRWLKPVRPGMVLSVRQNVVSARVMKSRPDLGLVGFDVDTHDQTGVVVMNQRYAAMFGRRDPSAPPPEPWGEAPARAPDVDEPPRLETDDENMSRFSACFEDVRIGARLRLGAHTFTREETIDFARRFDPQPFHLDDAAAAASHFGRLSASGWHTGAMYMKLYVETRERIREHNRARGLPVVPNGPSPGVRNLQWLRPVFPGDTIAYESTVMSKRPSSRPGWGHIGSRVQAFNQAGQKVYELFGASLTPMRETST